MALSTNKIGDYFSSGQKIFSALMGFIVAVSTLTIAYYKINQNTVNLEQYKKDSNAAIEELRKETVHKLEDEHDLILKVMSKNREQDEQQRKDEIQDAYFRGHQEALNEKK